jgi:hypothetical protein
MLDFSRSNLYSNLHLQKSRGRIRIRNKLLTHKLFRGGSNLGLHYGPEACEGGVVIVVGTLLPGQIVGQLGCQQYSAQVDLSIRGTYNPLQTSLQQRKGKPGPCYDTSD